jgi:PIN domain nuclease of toxin-antitoxin system
VGVGVNLLIDTHVLLSWWTDAGKVSRRAKDAIVDARNRSYISAAVAWELAIKVNLGKLNAREVVSTLPQLLLEEGFRRLAISTDHALRAGLLPLLHRDPFDRMLVAQAQALNSPIVSADGMFDRYGVTRIW